MITWIEFYRVIVAAVLATSSVLQYSIKGESKKYSPRYCKKVQNLILYDMVSNEKTLINMERNTMIAHLSDFIAKVIIFFSYMDVIVDLLNIGLLDHFPLIGLGLLIIKILNFSQVNRKNISFIDILATIVFMYGFASKIPISLILNANTLNLARIEITYQQTDISWVVQILYSLLFLAVVNLVLKEYGYGVTRIMKVSFFYFKYKVLYRLLILNKQFNSAWLSNQFRSFLKLTQREFELITKSAIYRKAEKRSAYPVVLRKDAERKSFMHNWLYNISLVEGEDICISKKRSGNQTSNSIDFTIEVNLSRSSLAIVNNEGKKFLRELYQNDSQDLLQNSKDIYTFLTTDIKGKPQNSMNLPAFFFRWGSAGTLPIVEWKNKKWIAFVYRDIYPCGWNLPLGASESELEKARPAITAIREMLEELIITDREFCEYTEGELTQKIGRYEIYHHLLNSIDGEVSYQACKRKFYSQQEAIIGSTCKFTFKDEGCYENIQCLDIATPLEICTKDTKKKTLMLDMLNTNCLMAINCLEQGIECIKPVQFKVNDDVSFRMGEVDYSQDKWINNPVILISYDALSTFFQRKNISYPSASKDTGESLYMELLNDPNNYCIFGLNLEQRYQRMNELGKFLNINSKSYKVPEKNGFKYFFRKDNYRIAMQYDYLNQFLESNKDFFTIDGKINSKIKENHAMYLCPVAWKVLSCFFSPLYSIKPGTHRIGE